MEDSVTVMEYVIEFVANIRVQAKENSSTHTCRKRRLASETCFQSRVYTFPDLSVAPIVHLCLVIVGIVQNMDISIG